MFYRNNLSVDVFPEDRSWFVQSFLRDFLKYLEPFNYNKELQAERFRNLAGFISSGMFAPLTHNQEQRGYRHFQYHDFSLKPSAFGKALKRTDTPNLLWHLSNFARGYNPRGLTDGQLQLLRVARVVGDIADPEFHKHKSAKLDRGPGVRHLFSMTGKSAGAANDNGAVIATPYRYKEASKLRSGLSSFGWSFLVGSTSRIAIMAALGFTGAPALAVPVVAGMGAGLVTGAFRSYRANRVYIQEQVKNETTFWGRLKARARGFAKSWSWKQGAVHAVTGGLGTAGGIVAADYLLDNQYIQPLKDHFVKAAAPVTHALGTAYTMAAGQAQTYYAALTDELGWNPLDTIQTAVTHALPSPDHVAEAAPAVDMTAAVPIAADTITPRSVHTLKVMPDGTIVDGGAAATRIAAAHEIAATSVTADQAAQEADIAERLRGIAAANNAEAALQSAAQPSADSAAELSAATADDGLSVTASDTTLAAEPADALQPSGDSNAAAATEQIPADSVAANDDVMLGTHAVVSGDVSWNLVEDYYKIPSTDAAAHWDAIKKVIAANPQYPELLSNPNGLKIGWSLNMPDLAQTTHAAECNIVRGRVRSCTLG